MTTRLIRDATDTAEDFEYVSDFWQGTTMIALAEYERDEYDDWCRIRGWDKSDPQVEARYQAVHYLYFALWNKLEADRFFFLLERGRKQLQGRRT